MTAATGFDVIDQRAFERLRPEWDALASRSADPFASAAWLDAWAKHFTRRPLIFVLRGSNGRLRGAAYLVRRRTGLGLASASNDYTGSWNVLAPDADVQADIWQHIAQLGVARLRLAPLPDTAAARGQAETALSAAGYGIVCRRDVRSPRLALPSDRRQLLLSGSRQLRAQLKQARQRLERVGPLALRTATVETVAADLHTFITLEAAGWKGRNGSAIASDSRAVGLFQDFAHAAARQGWLRLHLLECAGKPVAGDLCVVFDQGMFMLKTAYDERYAPQRPGMVLMAESMFSAIDEGLRFYDMLGNPEPYKLRWGPVTIREHVRLDAYRGVWLPTLPARRVLRPLLKSAVSRSRSLQARLFTTRQRRQ